MLSDASEKAEEDSVVGHAASTDGDFAGRGARCACGKADPVGRAAVRRSFAAMLRGRDASRILSLEISGVAIA